MPFIVGPPYDFDQLQHAYESRVPGVSQEIAPGELMPHEHKAHYFGIGEDVIRLIKLALLSSRKRGNSIRHILDLPCGHGRVMRFLRAAFPEASLTACDLLTDGVDYCARAFNAEPVYSQTHPTGQMFPHAGEYDLIFVGSLFTHLEANRWHEFLSVFAQLLAPDGIMIFTTHGPFVARRFQTPAAAMYGYNEQHLPQSSPPSQPRPLYLDHPFPAPPDQFTNAASAHIIEQYRSTGFGYLDDGHGFGISISHPSWTLKQVENHPSLRILHYLERGWDNHQDVCTVIKRPFDTTDATVGHPFI